MNLILTPVYMAFDKVQEMCHAIDTYSTMPFIHILIDDNSPQMPPVTVTETRKWILLRDAVQKVKNNENRAIQTGWDYALHRFDQEKERPRFDNLFLIESDVIVQKDWDKLMIEESGKLTNWATLDPVSTDTNEEVGYPSKLIHSKAIHESVDEIDFPEFNCTLFSKECLQLGWKFTDFASHFDILLGRKLKTISNLKCYRHRYIKVLHYGNQSRSVLNPECF